MTVSNGIAIAYDGTANARLHWDSSSILQLLSREHGAGIKISAENASGVEKDILWGDPDSNTAIYHSGGTSFSTRATGFNCHTSTADSATDLYLKNSADVDVGLLRASTTHLYLRGMIHGEAVEIGGENSSGVYKAAIIAEPDNAVKLYYAGLKSFSSTATGVAVWDTNGDLPILHLQNDGGSIMAQLGLSSYAYYRSYVDGKDLWFSGDDSGGTAIWVGIDVSAPAFIPSPASSSSVTGLSLGTSSNKWKDVWAFDTSINNSDATTKTVISGSELGLDFINRLNPVAFRWNDGTRPHQGVIAQEVKEVMDDLDIDFAGYIDPYVSDYPDGWTPPASGTEGPEVGESEPKLGMRYSEFIAPLIKSVQELTDIVNTQQATISGLEARIETLEA